TVWACSEARSPAPPLGRTCARRAQARASRRPTRTPLPDAAAVCRCQSCGRMEPPKVEKFSTADRGNGLRALVRLRPGELLYRSDPLAYTVCKGSRGVVCDRCLLGSVRFGMLDGVPRDTACLGARELRGAVEVPGLVHTDTRFRGDASRLTDSARPPPGLQRRGLADPWHFCSSVGRSWKRNGALWVYVKIVASVLNVLLRCLLSFLPFRYPWSSAFLPNSLYQTSPEKASLTVPVSPYKDEP
ncbi:Histone-lysine N-methyltransferase SMYD3, partial [Galemys pyrenaicus]